MSARTSTDVAAGTVSEARVAWWAGPAILTRPWVWVGLLTVVAMLLRRYHLGEESLWFDEADLVQRARQSLPALFESFTKAGENGPLYTLMLHFWLAAIAAFPPLARVLHPIFGHNDEALVRGLSAVFGAAAIPLIYMLGKRAGGVAVGLVAAALLTFNPFHIWHSQDAKMYTLLVLMTLAGSLLYIEAWERNTVRLWLGYVLATWIMFSIHSITPVVLLAQLLVTPFFFRSARRTLGAGAARARLVRWGWSLLLIILPVFPIVWLRVAAFIVGTDVGGWYTPTGLGDILSTIFVKFAVNHAPQPWELVGSAAMGLLALLGVTGFCTLLLRSRHQGTDAQYASEGGPEYNKTVKGTRSGKALVLALWLVPIVAFWLVTLKLPLFQPRYLIMALPPYLILAAAGLLSPRRFWPLLSARSSAILALVGLLAVGLPTASALAGVNYAAQPQKEDWRGAIGYVEDHLRLRDVIVVFPGYMVTAVNYYYHPGGTSQVPQVDIKTIPSLRTKNFGETQLNATLRDVVTCHERAWLITSPTRQAQEDPDNKVQQWFQYNWHTFDTKVFNGVTVYGISFNGQPNCWYPEPDHKEPHSFTNGIDFLGYIYELRGTANTQPDASYFPLTIYWRNTRQMNHDYVVRVTVKSPVGVIVAHEDLGPLNGYWPTTQWPPGTQVIDYRDVRLPGGLPPGDYMVSLSLYPSGQPDQPLKLKEGGTEIVFRDKLHVVPWQP